jgi:purine-binding chemotaxis protein CheW
VSTPTATANGTAAAAAAPAPDAPAQTRQLVVCALGDEEYGIPIGQVREIVRAVEPRPVASELPWMRGVIGLRGRLVPVHDLAVRLGVVTSPAGVRSRSPAVVTSPAGVRSRSPEGETGVPPSAKLVIVETAADPVAVLVDDVVEVLRVEAAQIEPVPSGSGEIARVGERLVLLLDAGELA